MYENGSTASPMIVLRTRSAGTMSSTILPLASQMRRIAVVVLQAALVRPPGP